MSAMTGLTLESAPAPKRSTATVASTGQQPKILYLREITGVNWLQGNRIECRDSLNRPITMTRQRVSVLVEGPGGVVEIPDAMIRAIGY